MQSLACLAVLLALVAAALAATPGPASRAEAPQLRLGWQRGPLFDAGGEQHSSARITIANTGTAALPAAGWSIYFTCLAEVEPADDGGAIAVEHVNGTLYRLRPRAAFGGLAAGATATIDVRHAAAVHNPSLAPEGAYLITGGADAPGQPIATTYSFGATQEGEVTPARLYERYGDLGAAPTASQVPAVFPTPLASMPGKGSVHWAGMPRIEAAAALEPEASNLRRRLAAYLAAQADSSPAALVSLRIATVEGLASPEAYELRIDPARGVAIAGNSAAGVARGVATLHELLPVQPDPAHGADLPALVVRDAPRYAYRGLMLDVARNFQPGHEVMRMLDLMARYKLNALHLHLTDDEGWRIDIAGLPELVSYGARRGHTDDESKHLAPAHGSGPDAGNPFGSGHYTRAEYVAILRHAAALRIEVSPEIEMPGHARAAVKAMAFRERRLAAAGDEAAARFRLRDPGDASAYRSAQGYDDNVMDPGLESTYAFIDAVVAALASMHEEAGLPLRQVHMGGDELAAGAWTASPAVRELMAREHLADRQAVWDYFYGRIAAILRRHGVALAGWDELGARKARGTASAHDEPNPAALALDPTLYAWRDGDEPGLGCAQARAGFRVVLVPASRFYFDLSAFPGPDEPGMQWAGHTDLDTAFDYAPCDDPHVRGLEATVFSETVRAPGRLEYMLMPRLLAMAERAWAPEPAWAKDARGAAADAAHRRDWERFAAQLGWRLLPRLDAERAGVGYRIAPPGLVAGPQGVLARAQLPGYTLRYTSDGTDPVAGSAPVTGPVRAAGEIRVAAFAADGRRGHVSSIHQPSN